MSRPTSTRWLPLAVALWGCVLGVWLARLYFTLPVDHVHRNHEWNHYAVRVLEFRSLLGAGYWSPEWATHFRGGLGSPYFGYYHPGVFYAASLVPWSVAPNTALGLTVVGFSVVGYGSMFLLVRRWFGTLSGVLAASLLLLSVYPATEVSVRGDLAEFSSMMLVPAIFEALSAWLAEGRFRDAALLALAGAGTTVTHAAIGLVVHGGLAVLLVVLFVAPKTRWRAVGAAVAVAAGVGLAAFYWFPVFFQWQLVSPDAAFQGFFSYQRHFVEPLSLLGAYSRKTTVPFTLGWIIPSLALCNLVNVIALRRGTVAQRNVVLIGTGALAASVFLLSSGSGFVWEASGTLQRLQFPWRILSLVTVFSVALAGAMTSWGAPALAREKWRAAFVGVVLLGAALASREYTAYAEHPSLRVPPSAEALTQSYFAPDIQDEWMPRGAKLDAKKQKARLPAAEPGATISDYQLDDGKLTAQVHATTASFVRLPHYYFPAGWEATQGGQRLDLGADARGMMRVSLPAGADGTLEVRFTMTPMRKLGLWVSFATAALGVAAWLGFTYRRRAAPSA